MAALAAFPMQPQFLIVMDVEATCEQGFPEYASEVIELPMVVVDVRQPLTTSASLNADALPGTVAACWRSYIRPEINPVLSDFCTKLTGIKQSDVESAPLLHQAIDSCDTWLRRTLARLGKSSPHTVRCAVDATGIPVPCEPTFSEPKADTASASDARDSALSAESGAARAALPTESELPPFAFLTDGPWDIKNFLQPDCHRKCLLRSHWPRKPPYWDSWVDMRSHFAECLNAGRRLNLRSMLAKVNLRFIGSEHSGLHDSFNIARIARSMLAAGVRLTVNDGLTREATLRWLIPIAQGKEPARGELSASAEPFVPDDSTADSGCGDGSSTSAMTTPSGRAGLGLGMRLDDASPPGLDAASFRASPGGVVVDEDGEEAADDRSTRASPSTGHGKSTTTTGRARARSGSGTGGGRRRSHRSRSGSGSGGALRTGAEAPSESVGAKQTPTAMASLSSTPGSRRQRQRRAQQQISKITKQTHKKRLGPLPPDWASSTHPAVAVAAAAESDKGAGDS